MRDAAVTNHLYRIAQEAVHNAVRHGRASTIRVCLGGRNGTGILCIHDDGCGISDRDASHSGMGLNIMRYRAGMIGGALEIVPGPERGTAVICRFPN